VAVHLQHVSAEASLRLLAEAKDEGLPVTAEATPHHLLLTDELVQTFDQNLRVNPPLRSEADRQALVAALREGLVDCIGTDHAPHAPHEKEVPFEQAASGTVGLETAFAALYGGLVAPGEVGLDRLVEAMSAAPCRCLGLQAPHLRVGAPADLCVVDLEEAWTVTPGDLRGKSRNSAFLGRPVQGRVLLTVVGGARRFQRPRREEGARV
jgi:dihydroorotase